jgi:histidinol-phosphate/aromatic aminotransferase/cobyric acid decarboxylase-like protein/GNAT superfamily N-acetyltransferase
MDAPAFPSDAPTLSRRPRPLVLALADDADRAAIYRMRHDVYARELGQHPENDAAELRDPLDAFNVYVVARRGRRVVGFVSVTPPGHGRYSIDKYVSRDELPFACDAGLYEIRLLTIAPAYRGSPVAYLLMYAAFQYALARGATRVVAVGRREVADLYRKVGLRPLGRQVACGRVVFELMAGTAHEIAGAAGRDRVLARVLGKMRRRVRWRVGVPFRPLRPLAPCFHGGASISAVGDDFSALHRRDAVVNADVLDAWFPPAPGVLEALSGALPWLVRTSPPAGCEGFLRAVSAARGVPEANLVPGAGSSDLIFRALRHWLTPRSRVLLPDPTYGEYAHVLERVIGCRVERLTLARADGYAPDPARLDAAAGAGFDLIVLVNPNSPTGRHVGRRSLEPWLRRVPPRTRVWVDETYVDYAGPGESVERVAAASANVVVCKSMSKAYALSGMRCAYLCAPAALAAEIRSITPPWVMGLPAQVAAVRALADPEYYAARHAETRALRRELHDALAAMPGVEVIPGAANFLLAHLPTDGPDAATVVDRCRRKNVYLRDASGMGGPLGPHALRVAVKARQQNGRIVDAVREALRTAVA